MATITLQAKAESQSATHMVVKTGGFTLHIDEPASLGGSDTGPNPVQYVLAELAGCLNVVGHLVAGEMGIQLKGLKVDIRGKLDPACFQGTSDAVRAGLQEVEVQVTPNTDASPERLAQWMATVEQRCPVSDNLANSTTVIIVLTPAK